MAAMTIRCHAEGAQNNWICPITEDIDRFLINKSTAHHSYLYICELDLEDIKPLISIRLPGCTIGQLILNKDFEITDVGFNSYSSRFFVSSPLNAIKKYIGYKLEVNLP